mgnify:CR=1 FL=1
MFKLGSEKRSPIARRGAVIKGDLRQGVLGEARNDGTIVVDSSLKKGSKKYNEVVNHEKQHQNDMASGDLSYTDISVKWKGKNYPRKDGKIFYNTKWHVEGHSSLPWEAKAEKAEKKTMVDADARPKSAAFQKSYKK